MANATNNLTSQLVSAAALENAALALVSALYLKGEWHEKFNRTEPGKFLSSATGVTTVDMRKMETAVPYTTKDTFDAISLLYKDPDYCMLLLRPLKQAMSAVEKLRDSLDKIDISSVVDQMHATRGLHGADFQPQLQSTPFSWIQIHSNPNSKINGASIPIHMKVRSVFTCIV